MPHDSIERIHQAEAEAEAIRQKALDDSRDQIRTSEEEIAVWKEGELKAARKEARDTIKSAEDRAEQEADQKRHEDKKRQEKVRQDAMQNMDKAVNYIVERIIEAK